MAHNMYVVKYTRILVCLMLCFLFFNCHDGMGIATTKPNSSSINMVRSFKQICALGLGLGLGLGLDQGWGRVRSGSGLGLGLGLGLGFD